VLARIPTGETTIVEPVAAVLCPCMELASSQAIHRELVCRSEATKQTLRAFP
jgi:hypothetical protein